MRKIVDSFKGLGIQLSPAVIWPNETHPFELEKSTLPALAAFRDYLSTAAIMGNQYMNVLTNPITDAHMDGFFQNFKVGSLYVATETRRREGRYLDGGLPIEDTHTVIPQTARPQHQFNVDEELINALTSLLAPSSDVQRQIDSAIPFFVQANRLDQRTSVQYDLVFLGAAFERLFKVSGAIGAGLADAITALLSGFEHGSTTWTNRSQAGNVTSDSGPWIKRWMREFYEHRSSIHGGSAHNNTWDDKFHALIGTEVFALSVMILLEQEGLRDLTDSDTASADALDERIERLAGLTTEGLTEAWSEPMSNALTRQLARSIADELKKNGLP